MKRTSIDPPPSPAKQARGVSDNLCKRLAEEYPAQFARWLFGVDGNVKVEKTEMSREPIRADSVIFSRGASETLHAEFQTTMKSEVPLPLRLLDCYVGLKRLNPSRRVRQALIVLKETGEKIPDRYQDERTVHSYDVVKLWEEDPAELMKYEGLLPLATLCRTDSSEKLLKEVAEKIRRIKSRERRRETLNWSRVLAGLRYDKILITRILKESDMLEESVIYQDIFHKGEQKGEKKGLQEGAEQEARKVAIRLLELRFGKVSRSVQQQIDRLEVEQLEALCEALLEFRSKENLTRWLKKHAPNRGNGA
jgi:predicted transposase YdaD